MTATTCTLVIPKKAIQHPTIEETPKVCLRNNLESMAVNTMLPPREICQTELSTMFSAM